MVNQSLMGKTLTHRDYTRSKVLDLYKTGRVSDRYIVKLRFLNDDHNIVRSYAFNQDGLSAGTNRNLDIMDVI